MDQATAEALAAMLRKAEADRAPCPPLRLQVPDAGPADAYCVQAINTAHALSEGRRLAGRKIGLTARSVQVQLGVDQPDYGMLFADMILGDAEPIACGRVLQPKVEVEVALVLEHDLAMERPTVTDVIRATAYALPAIEVVGSRIAGWDIRIFDTIADNASSGLVVLGGPPRRLEGLDLRMCGMTLERRGEPVSTGAGAACLGSPLTAAAWLAAKMVEVGQPLKAGDLVMTGALGPMVAVEPGDVLQGRISGLGSVRAVFDREAA